MMLKSICSILLVPHMLMAADLTPPEEMPGKKPASPVETKQLEPSETELELPKPQICEKPARSAMTGDWHGVRNTLKDRGIEFEASLTLDDTWNLAGGKRTSPGHGEFEYLFDLNMKLTSDPLFHYSGGTFFVDFQSHHGQSPSAKDVGSFVQVDLMEAPAFDELYALWYKQSFGEAAAFWFLVGKSDAYDTFTNTVHSSFFLNDGYTAFPTIPFFPSYPNPAMSVIASLKIPHGISFTAGVFDGALAEGYNTGKHGVFGRFFNNLSKHAFLMGEFNLIWEWWKDCKGRLGLGGWKTTAELTQFNGKMRKGTKGPYLTIDQTFHKSKLYEGGVFFIYSSANPQVSSAHRYIAAGTTWQGISSYRADDIIGVGISQVNFTQDKAAGFTEHHETAYEIFYHLRFAGWGFLEPDYQYVVHPGGKGLPNASVFTLRLQLTL